MPKTVSVKKDGISQTVHVHIHEKSKEKKRRQKRRKVSRGGAIRTINRGNLTASSIGSNIGFGTGAYQGLPQMRRTAQQLLVLPEGDKALGQVGVKQLTAGEQQTQQIGLQKKLIMESIKEYEAEVKGKSTKERTEPVIEVIDLTGGTPKSTTTVSIIAPLHEVSATYIVGNKERRDEAIEFYGIDTKGLNKTKINAKIKEAHKKDVEAHEQDVGFASTPATPSTPESFSSPINSPPSNPLGGKKKSGKKTAIPFNPFT
jgi:hypothetical protein